ncbi:MAG: nucleotidyltransferase [Flavobacteriaceae bacterium]|mgnify:FL=1|nr:nucleotidyltransferase [Flavobacteriaceae bacterium]|tara:strand:- start:3201 stop:4043 length:843 start_codon:yes stop_codon:yes gene_type:complete
MNETLVILAAGLSSRMKKSISSKGISSEAIEQANQISKGLIALGKSKRPLLDYLINNARISGYKSIYLIIGEDSKLFKTTYSNNPNFSDLSISFATQYIPDGRVKPLGTADALVQAMDQYPQLKKISFSVCNSDNLYSVNALSKLRENPEINSFIAYDSKHLKFPEDRLSSFAVTILDNENKLLDIIEKPKKEEIDSFRDKRGVIRVSMNIFSFKGDQLYKYVKLCPIHKDRNEKELPIAVLNMIKDFPGSMQGIPMAEHVPDLTSKDDIVEIEKYLGEF